MNPTDINQSPENVVTGNSKRSQIRHGMRARRCSLSAAQQQLAATRLGALMLEDEDFQQAETIAFYRAFDGEINPHQLLLDALAQGKRCYLPILDEAGVSMTFAEYDPDKSMILNHYGIEEPGTAGVEQLSPEYLDVILLPLVAFDNRGTRLGMGKGYYDRYLAEVYKSRIDSRQKTPKLIGLAHEFQRVEKLDRADWDIPLDKIITDQTAYRCLP